MGRVVPVPYPPVLIITKPPFGLWRPPGGGGDETCWTARFVGGRHMETHKGDKVESEAAARRA